MIRRTLKAIAEQIAYKTKDVSTLLDLIIIIAYTKHMIETDNSPALFLIAVSVFFYFPLLLIVIYLLLLIPKFICILILEVMKIKKQNNSRFDYNSNYNYDGDKEYKWENQQSYDWWKEQYRSYQEQQNSTYNDYNKENYQNRNDRQQNNTTRRTDELSEALSFYGLKIPFTESELKDKRRKLMKTAHPDEGGDTETAANINRYFDILKKYAS